MKSKLSVDVRFTPISWNLVGEKHLGDNLAVKIGMLAFQMLRPSTRAN